MASSGGNNLELAVERADDTARSLRETADQARSIEEAAARLAASGGDLVATSEEFLGASWAAAA